MKNFLYIYGVYKFCVLIHETLDYVLSDRVYSDMKRFYKEINNLTGKDKKEEEKKIKPRSAHVVTNRIGF